MLGPGLFLLEGVPKREHFAAALAGAAKPRHIFGVNFRDM
jgi:hypothetical protein